MCVVWCASQTSARERMVASQSSESATASRKAPARSTRASALAIASVIEKLGDMLTRGGPRSSRCGRLVPLLDRLGQRDEALRLLHVEVLHQPAIDDHHALALRRGPGVRSHDLSRAGQLLGGRGEDLVGQRDGLRVDEGLAVESHLAGLATGCGEASLVVEVEMHPIEDSQT